MFLDAPEEVSCLGHISVSPFLAPVGSTSFSSGLLEAPSMGESEVETFLPEQRVSERKLGVVASFLVALLLLTGCLFAWHQAKPPNHSPSLGKIRGSEVIEKIEPWTQPEGVHQCVETTCWETQTGVIAAPNCPKETCTHYDYWDDKVGRHVEDCTWHCQQHPGCKYGFVGMQSDWKNSACFFLKKCTQMGISSHSWGVACQVKERAVGKWNPLCALNTGAEVKKTLKHGVEKSETSETEKVATTSSSYSFFNAAGHAPFSATVEGKVSTLFSQEVVLSEEESFSITLHPKPGESYLWQWVFKIVDGVTVKTQNYALTSGAYEAPKCFPGYNLEGDNSYQKCHSATYELKSK